MSFHDRIPEEVSPMTQTMQGTTRRSETGRTLDSPVDDRTYDLLQALTSKLEAIDAYDRYSRDGEGELFSELAADERRHAERLLEALRQALGSR